MTLDRSQWEGCAMCNSEYPMWYLMNSSDKFEPAFCPNCGRPRSERAWGQMEQRITKYLLLNDMTKK